MEMQEQNHQIQYKINRVFNATPEKLKIMFRDSRNRISQLLTLNKDQSHNFVFDNKQKAHYIPAVNQDGSIKLKMFIDQKAPKKSQWYVIQLQPEDNNISIMLSAELNNNKIYTAVTPFYPWITSYNIEIKLEGENLEESMIKLIPDVSTFDAEYLITAIKQYDFDKIKEIIRSGVNILAQDNEGNSPLYYAVQNDWGNPLTEQIFGFLLSVNPQLLTIANNEGEIPLSLVPPQTREKVMDIIGGKYEEKN